MLPIALTHEAFATVIPTLRDHTDPAQVPT